eukprot:629513-Hanusia_phi.AAC.2
MQCKLARSDEASSVFAEAEAEAQDPAAQGRERDRGNGSLRNPLEAVRLEAARFDDGKPNVH